MTSSSNSSLLPGEVISRAKRHICYIARDFQHTCFRPKGILPFEDDACTFVRNTEECAKMVQEFNYLEYLVCDAKFAKMYDTDKVAIIFGLLLTCFYVLILLMISKYFIAPNISTLYEHMKLDEYEFGYVVVGSLFNTMDILYDANVCKPMAPPVILADYVGKTLCQFVAGISILCLKRNFNLDPTLFTQCIIILFLGNWYTFQVGQRRMFNGNEGIPNMLSLGFHCTVCIIVYFLTMYGYMVVKRFRRKNTDQEDDDVEQANPNGHQAIEEPGTFRPSVFRRSRRDDPLENNPNVRSIAIQCYDYEIDQHRGVWWEFRTLLNPYQHMRGWHYSVVTLLLPLWVMLALLIPVYNRDRHLHGWSKYMLCISYLLFAFLHAKSKLPTSYKPMVVIIVSILLCVTLMETSGSKLPKYFYIFTVPSILIAYIYVTIIDGEIDAMAWQMFIYLGNWWPDILSLIVLQIGNVFSKTVLIVALGQCKLIKVAFGILMSTTIYTTLFSLPTSVGIFCPEITYLGVSANVMTAFIFLFAIFASLAVGIPFADFELRLSHGIFTMLMFTLYLFYVRRTRDGGVHSFGSHGTSKVRYEGLHVGWA